MSDLFPEQDPAGNLPVRPLAGAPTPDGLAPLAGDGPPSPPPEAASPNMLALIERLLESNPHANVEVIERLLAVQERITARDAEMAFNAAKGRVKSQLAGIRIVKRKVVKYDVDKNDKSKGQYDSFKYAPLEEIDKYLSPLLAAEEMDLAYSDEFREGGGLLVRGRLKHLPGGYFEDSFMAGPLDTTGGKTNIQAVGSTNSYLRRYIACNLFNIVVIGDDDDGTGGTIDEAQAKAIRELLEETGSDKAKFLKYLKAPTIEEIPYRSYPKAMSALEEKRAKEKPSA